MNLFVSYILLSALSILMPLVNSTVVVTATAGTILAVAGIAALGKAKGVAVGAAAGAASARRRGRRQVEVEMVNTEVAEEQVWDNVANLEDSECVRRFLCEVATKQFEAQDYQPIIEDKIENSKDGDVYANAIRYGLSHPTLEDCREAYQCSNTGLEIYQAYQNLEQ